MVCSSYTVAAIESLVAVTLTGKVSFSAYEPKHTNAFNITQGETFTISFLADPKATVRMGISDPTITVHDNVAPYEVCATDFSMKFEKGVSAQLGAPPVSLLGEVGSFYFALSQARPVRDAAWLSQDVVVPGAVGTAVEQTAVAVMAATATATALCKETATSRIKASRTERASGRTDIA